ncbi:MAG: glycoside hydrolase family 3 protein [Planctomycetota bacterium]|nr:MAG: glycoside hydrolase family 3 protein [Planctomycetota bacterium]
MTIESLCGRIMMVGVRGGTMDDPRTIEDVQACKRAKVGGVILFATDLGEGGDRNIHHPEQLRRLVADMRHELGADLIVSIDQEGGRVARLRPERGFEPHVSAASFGRMDAYSQRAQARAQARQLASLGIDLNFAPCVDLLINPEGPAIGAKDRAFSRDPEVAAQCARIWIDEHDRVDVRCCIKHFPGHGSAEDDTHEGLVDLTDTYDEPTELSVFERLIDDYGSSIAVMTAHLMHRGIDTDRPASLSRAHTGGLLRARLGFDGVVITDSLDMGAITQLYSQSDAMALALDAGADILLDGVNMPGRIRPAAALPMHRALVELVTSGRIRGGEERIARSVERIDALFRTQPA